MKHAILCSVLCLAVHGQTFEAASIKPATPVGPMGLAANRKGGPGTNDPGTYTCQNCPISWVLSEAYRLDPWEMVAPEWLGNTRFDFAAKVPGGTTKETFQSMLQNLLVTRFNLAVHHDKKEMTVFELTVAKGGPKFHESTPTEVGADAAPSGRPKTDAEGFPILQGGTTMAIVPGHARIRSEDRPIPWFAKMLAGQLHGPVIDATGLKGKYDFLVSWAFDDSNGSKTPADGIPVAVLDPFGPALIDAVQSQLGLKIEQKKGKADVLVVDHIEKTPTAN